LLTYTLDLNCLISLEKAESVAKHFYYLIEAHLDRRIQIAVPAIAASEQQTGGQYLENFGEFQERLARLQLSNARLIEPIAYFGIGFYGHGLWADDAMVQLERQIHAVLHPNIEFTLEEFCAARGIPVDTEQPAAKWAKRQMRCAGDVESHLAQE
jgi:hypothetical protein